MIIEMKNFIPLNSHQAGIKVKNKILEELEKNDELIILDFEDVDIFTDSFIQQLTIILAQEIGFETLKGRVKFRNLNDFLLKMVKEKLYIASGKKLVKKEKDIDILLKRAEEIATQKSDGYLSMLKVPTGWKVFLNSANADKSMEKERVLKLPSFSSLDEALYYFISKPI
jgi:hypothetical protein